ncbi:hypothetical protein F4861DRAFT_537208 [Xylaria intraflava]|nr:hypothetical protein F4861DRAFT_537208 [Xylaria intraflava]
MRVLLGGGGAFAPSTYGVPVHSITEAAAELHQKIEPDRWICQPVNETQRVLRLDVFRRGRPSSARVFPGRGPRDSRVLISLPPKHVWRAVVALDRGCLGQDAEDNPTPPPKTQRLESALPSQRRIAPHTLIRARRARLLKFEQWSVCSSEDTAHGTGLGKWTNYNAENAAFWLIVPPAAPRGLVDVSETIIPALGLYTAELPSTVPFEKWFQLSPRAAAPSTPLATRFQTQTRLNHESSGISQRFKDIPRSILSRSRT